MQASVNGVGSAMLGEQRCATLRVDRDMKVLPGPNVFVLGASRCGVGSLAAMLRQHPDISCPGSNARCVLTRDAQIDRNIVGYLRIHSSDHKYRLDACGGYLQSPKKLMLLRRIFPDAKFIVIVRDPKQRARSLYNYACHYGLEKKLRFFDALCAEAERRSSLDFFTDEGWPEPWAYLYCYSSMYDRQIERCFSLFSREQFYFITLAELSKYPVRTCKGILEFLGLTGALAASLDSAALNHIHDYSSLGDRGSDEILTAEFQGLTGRTDELVGRKLDWSL